MKHVAETYFHCQGCEDLVEPGDLVTDVPGIGPVCEDCRLHHLDDDEPGHGYWEAGDLG